VAIELLLAFRISLNYPPSFKRHWPASEFRAGRNPDCSLIKVKNTCPPTRLTAVFTKKAARITIPSMSRSGCRQQLRGFRAPDAVSSNVIRSRHENCIPFIFLENDSQSQKESVDSYSVNVKSRENSGALTSQIFVCDLLLGWNHGAARNAHRKRTCVRVACGGVQRSHGEGNNSSHGPFGRFLVGRESIPPVVLQPACKDILCQRHFSRGPRLLAALTTVCVRVTCISGSIQKAFWATRPLSLAVTGGAFFQKKLSGLSADWKRYTQPHPTHASAFG